MARMYLVYSRLTDKILFMHPVLAVATKISLILKHHDNLSICLLESLPDGMNCHNAFMYKIIKKTTEYPNWYNDTLEAKMSRIQADDLIDLDCLPIVAIAYDYPIAIEVEEINPDELVIDELILYIGHVVEQTYFAYRGFFLRDYIEVIETYMQLKELYFNNKTVLEFIEYDSKMMMDYNGDINIHAAEVYQACINATDVDSLKAELLEIAERTGSIGWAI